MNSINDQINNLNKKFHPDGKFIPGGVLDENKFKKTKTKMLIILKEVNDPKSNYNWSLPDLLNGIIQSKKPFYKPWKNISRWALVTNKPDLKYEEIDENMLKEGLKFFAVINLKKDTGSGKSDNNDILNVAKSYKQEWLEEIKIINPKIIICGGTFDIIVRALDVDVKNIFYCYTGLRFFIYKKRLFLEFYHPSCRKSYQFLYDAFKNTFASIKPLI